MNQESQNEPVVDLTFGETHICLLGTAHVSQASADKVDELITSGKYDAVAIELCPSRHNAIVNPDSLAKMDLFKVIKERKASMVAASLALGAFQQRLAEQFGIEPGAEMRTAIQAAEQAGLPIVLIDRELGITMRRIIRNVPWWRRYNLIIGLLASLLTREKITEDDIERLKEGDMLETTFSQFAEQEHDLFIPLIDERDRYMTARLMDSAETDGHKNILAIIGAGHMRGMENYFQHAPEKSPAEIIEELDNIPAGPRWPKVIPWVIVALVLVGFGIGFSRSTELGWQLVLDWVVINGGLSALGALIAGAHPLTIIGAFIAAPLTSLNPTIGAGMVTAAIEIYLRKPRVDDFSRLRSATTHIKGWWKNRVTRTLLVFMLSTLGSAVGTYLAGFRIFERLTGA